MTGGNQAAGSGVIAPFFASSHEVFFWGPPLTSYYHLYALHSRSVARKTCSCSAVHKQYVPEKNKFYKKDGDFCSIFGIKFRSY